MSVRLSAPRSVVRVVGGRPVAGAKLEVGGRRTQAMGALYDREATIAYRIAMLVLNDPDAAARALETTFLGLDPDRVPAGERAVRACVLRLLHHALGNAQQIPPSSERPPCDVSLEDRQALAYCAHGAGVSEVADLLGVEPAEIHARLGRALRVLTANRLLANRA
jgi:hypothetical protein